MANRLENKPNIHFLQNEPIPDSWGQFIFNPGDQDTPLEQYPGLLPNAELYSTVDNFLSVDDRQLIYGYGTLQVNSMYIYGTNEVKPNSDVYCASNLSHSVYLLDDALNPELKDWIRVGENDGSAYYKDCGTSNFCDESGPEFWGINQVDGNCDNCNEKWHEIAYTRRLINFKDNTYCHHDEFPGCYQFGAPEDQSGGWWWQLVGSSLGGFTWTNTPDNNPLGAAFNFQTFPAVSCGTSTGLPTEDVSSCAPAASYEDGADWPDIIDRDAFFNYDNDGALYFMLNMHTSHRTYIDCDAWCDYSCHAIDDSVAMYRIPKSSIYKAWSRGKERTLYFHKTSDRNKVDASTYEYYPVPASVRQNKGSYGAPWRAQRATFKIFPPGTTDGDGIDYPILMPNDIPEDQRPPGFDSNMWLDASDHLYPLNDLYSENYISGIDFTGWSPNTPIDFQRLKKLGARPADTECGTSPGGNPHCGLLTDSYTEGNYKDNTNYFLSNNLTDYRPVSYVYTEKVKYQGQEDGLWYYDQLDCESAGQTCSGDTGCEEFIYESSCLYGNDLECTWSWADDVEGQVCDTDVSNVYLQGYYDKDTNEEDFNFTTAPLQFSVALGLTADGQQNPPFLMNPIWRGTHLVGTPSGDIYGSSDAELAQCQDENDGCMDIVDYHYLNPETASVWVGVIGMSIYMPSNPEQDDIVGFNISDIYIHSPWFSESDLYGEITDAAEGDNPVIRGAIHNDGIGFMWFVANWDWKDGDPDGEDILSEMPSKYNRLVLKQERENLFKWQYIFDENGNHGTLSHQYNDGGTKIIKAVVVNYMHHSWKEYKHMIQPLKWKIITITANVNIDPIYLTDFSEIGGLDFTYIPWNETSPMIGGIHRNSLYWRSLRQVVQENNFGADEAWDRLLVEKSYDNDELGEYFGPSDISQVRYFASGSFDMYELLNLKGNDDGFNLYNNFDFWDGINNTYSGDSSVGQLFINDNIDSNLKNSTVFELNMDQKDLTHIPDTFGDTFRGILIGDYSLKKPQKGQSMTRDRKLNTPNVKKGNTGGAF